MSDFDLNFCDYIFCLVVAIAFDRKSTKPSHEQQVQFIDALHQN